jgi:dTDP-4-dehydrorhamnose 3,5-epimerase
VIFTAVGLAGVWLTQPEVHADERGCFVRTFDRELFARRGLVAEWAQQSVSFNRRRGTLRGLHFQTAPHQETKLLRCTRGTIYDVVLDLRPSSPTFRQHHAIRLSARDRCGLYLPPGIAHGFQTLEDDTEVEYHITPAYAPVFASGVRFDDPAFAIPWPLEVSVISARDRAFPDYADDAGHADVAR